MHFDLLFWEIYQLTKKIQHVMMFDGARGRIWIPLKASLQLKQINKTNIKRLLESQVHSQEAYKLLRF